MYNRNLEFAFLTTLLFVLICLFLVPEKTRANGAAWSPGVASAPPRPLKQKDLLLTKEHVVFKSGEVIAKFWVKNPTKKLIHVTMGFPLEYKNYVQDKARIEEYAKQVLDKFEVTINGEGVEARLTKDMANEYPVVINWEMDYAPQRITKFVVKYPMHSSQGGSDNPGLGSEWSQSFHYITHTGSYWAAPIQEALFEYCDTGASLLEEYPSGHYRYWSEGGKKVTWTSVRVTPTPYRVNNGCVVWERKNWAPSEDIRVDNSGGYTNYENAWGYESPTEILDKWCGLSKDIKYKGNQFADSVKLAEIPLTKDKYKELIDESYLYLTGEPDHCNGDWCDPFYEFPQHLKTDYELILLRYFRNFIFALHGYKFKDDRLKQCFANVQPRGQNLSAIEQSNLELIQSIENKIKKVNKNAWTEVNKNLRAE